METGNQIQRICGDYGIRMNLQGYEYKMLLVEELRDNYGTSDKSLIDYIELIMEKAISKNMKLIKNEKDISVPNWFQEKVDFVYDFQKKKLIAHNEKKYFQLPLEKKEILEETDDNEEFYKDVLPSEAFETYKIKKMFYQQEAELFVKDEVDKIMPQIIKNLNKNKQIDRMSREIYGVLEENYV